MRWVAVSLLAACATAAPPGPEPIEVGPPYSQAPATAEEILEIDDGTGHWICASDRVDRDLANARAHAIHGAIVRLQHGAEAWLTAQGLSQLPECTVAVNEGLPNIVTLETTHVRKVGMQFSSVAASVCISAALLLERARALLQTAAARCIL